MIAGLRQVLVTGRRESDAAFTPVQKRHAEFVFQVSNLLAGCAPLSMSLASGNLAQCSSPMTKSPACPRMNGLH